MELYHIHTSNHYDDCFKEGKIINPGNSFNNLHYNFIDDSASIIVAEKEINNIHYNYRVFFNDYLEKKLERNNITKEEYEKILVFVKSYMHNSALNFREIILEEVRRECFNNRPSRYNCIWLADEDSLDYWLSKLNLKNTMYEIFKVEANGNLFVSTDSLLPNYKNTHKKMYIDAEKYWNPTENDLKNANDKEYLFTGELKILKKIK